MNARITIGLTGVLLLAGMALGFPALSVHAEPELTEASPAFGDVLQTLPESLHLCFSEPVKVDESADWKFNVSTPDGRALGLRIVFEPSGGCVDVFPGAPADPPQGIWTFDWLVQAQADSSEGSGVIKFQLGELAPGETPLEKPDSNGSGNTDDGDDTPAGLLVAIGAGVALVLVATGGFVISRRRRTQAAGK
jgi:hypothetical protein